MRWAIITDIHANREAFEAVLAAAEAQGAERYAFLGDFVGYGADPAWVVETVMHFVQDRQALAVMGNHDMGAIKGPPPGMVPHARDAILWTQSQLNEGQLAFLSSLPLTASEGDMLFVHANAAMPGEWGYIMSRLEAVRSLQATKKRYVFCGHTHEPALYHLTPAGKAGDFTPVANVPIAMSAHRQWLAVIGATGQPRDGNPAAAFAIFDQTKVSLTFHRVPYDAEQAAAKIRQARLPDRLAERLLHGL